MLSQRGVIQCYCFTVLTLAKCSHFWNQLCKSHTGVMPPKWHVGWGRRFGGRWMRNARVFLMSRMVIGADFDGHGWRKQRWWGRDGDVWCSGQEKKTDGGGMKRVGFHVGECGGQPLKSKGVCLSDTKRNCHNLACFFHLSEAWSSISEDFIYALYAYWPPLVGFFSLQVWSVCKKTYSRLFWFGAAVVLLLPV